VPSQAVNWIRPEISGRRRWDAVERCRDDVDGGVDEGRGTGGSAGEPYVTHRPELRSLEHVHQVDRDVVALDLNQRGALLGFDALEARGVCML
jgi:hypothetical protein